jgi:hypothetical protein
MPIPIETLPTHLTDAEKRNVFATNRGWEVQPGGNDNPNSQREVLTAIPQLATTLGAANIVSINWTKASSEVTQANGGTLALEFVFNQEVSGLQNSTIEATNETDPERNVVLTAVETNDNIARFENVVQANDLDANDNIKLADGAVISSNGDQVISLGSSDPADLTIAGLESLLEPVSIG